MEFFGRNKKVLIIAGIILAVSVLLFLLWRYFSKNNLENKPVNKDPKNYNRTDFFTAVLSGLGVPVSAVNICALTEWTRHEGGTAGFNPLNTTKTMNKGETLFNSAGVKNYPDFQTGVDATVKTLKLSYYSSIVDALRNESPTWKGNHNIVTALNTWGTTNYANTLV